MGGGDAAAWPVTFLHPPRPRSVEHLKEENCGSTQAHLATVLTAVSHVR